MAADPTATEMPSMVDAADAMARGELSATELLDSCIAAIDSRNEALNAFVHLDIDSARAAAAEVDGRRARGEPLGRLAGVPFGVKDLEDCAGMPTSQGSLLYVDDGPVTEDDVHVARLRAAGAIPIGKTATPEFGTLQYTRTLAFGTTRNPWDIAMTPGGSSGGSAAAVAAGLVPFATASDGGGSIRIPASFSGLVGLRPSFGRIPHPSADISQTTSVGIMATCVRDAAVHLDIAAGPDDADRTSLPAPTLSYEAAIDTLDVDGLRVGWSPDLGFAVVDPDVAALSRAAAEALAAAAAVPLLEVEVDVTDPVRTWLSANVVGSWLDIDGRDAYPNRLEELTPYVAHSLQSTADRPLRSIVSSLQRRRQLAADLAAVFAEVDVLLTPTTAVTAFVAEGPPPGIIGGVDVVERFGPVEGMAVNVPFTMLANLCWNPSCSVPAGLAPNGLPVGLQITGRRHADEVVLRLARLFEQAQPWPRHAPMGRPA
jgi:aspartyl-tRNA(Asn)/glutamyl-tRNA(Gln) amidotransferase subunit A